MKSRPIVWGLAKSCTWILQLRVPDTTRDDMLRERRPNTTVVVLCKMLRMLIVFSVLLFLSYSCNPTTLLSKCLCSKLQQPEKSWRLDSGGHRPGLICTTCCVFATCSELTMGPTWRQLQAASLQGPSDGCDAVMLCEGYAADTSAFPKKMKGDDCWWKFPMEKP